MNNTVFHIQIPVISNLPVGLNLQDHLGVYLGPFFIRQGLGTFFDRDFTPGEFVKWFTLGRGRLSSTGCEATGIISSDIAKARGEGDWPDIHLFQYSFTNFRLGAERVSKAFNLKQDETMKYLENDIGRDSLFLVVTGARPLSRGSIRLGGSSPYDRQIIDPNYLSDAEQVDLKVLLDGVKKTLFLMENTTASQRIGSAFTTTSLAGCEHLTFRSTPYWECFVRRFSVTLHHPVGTASLGSVVDTQLRVIGTQNLRVVDASIQPVVVVTNTQASTLMIAEKAADMINRFWSNENQIQKPQKPSLFGKWGGGGFGGFLGGNFWNKGKRSSSVTDSYKFNKGPVYPIPIPPSPQFPPSFAPATPSPSSSGSPSPSPPSFVPPTQSVPTFSPPSAPTPQSPPFKSTSSFPSSFPSSPSQAAPSHPPPAQLMPQPESPRPPHHLLHRPHYYQKQKPHIVNEPEKTYYDYDYDYEHERPRSPPSRNKRNFTGSSNNIDDPEDFCRLSNNL
ncbi:unnamed protein product [Orchesella dallaii]|uniref:Glucose-methanol-choline oxidoreductase C-terminal domain-containing protein n=1 Tax=Orchesella dallaii TaxID=48710 RepID=A0ABP1QC22_9HEXA